MEFISTPRMAEIAQNALDSFGELLTGKDLYNALSGSLKMNDEEILAAGFSSLKEFMQTKSELYPPEPTPKRVTEDEAMAIIDSFAPLGCFYLQASNGTYTGIDNRTGNAWVEEFQSKEECLEWLK